MTPEEIKEVLKLYDDAIRGKVMTWDEEKRRNIQLGMETVLYTTSAESVEVMKGLFAGIIIESRFDEAAIARIEFGERTMLEESHPIYPVIIPPKELARELHVRLRNEHNPKGGDTDEFFALLKWHADVCQCGRQWLNREEHGK